MSVRSDNVLADDLSFHVDPAGEALSVHDTIRRYHDSLIRFLRQRLRVKEDAADVAQEAYIRMMQYEGSREIQSPSSMLFRIAINVANDLGRSEQARRVADQLPIDGLELASDAARRSSGKSRRNRTWTSSTTPSSICRRSAGTSFC